MMALLKKQKVEYPDGKVPWYNPLHQSSARLLLILYGPATSVWFQSICLQRISFMGSAHLSRSSSLWPIDHWIPDTIREICPEMRDIVRHRFYVRGHQCYQLPSYSCLIKFESSKPSVYAAALWQLLMHVLTVISLDLPWSSAVEGQSFDRVRIWTLITILEADEFPGPSACRKLYTSSVLWLHTVKTGYWHKQMLSDRSLASDEGDGMKIGKLRSWQNMHSIAWEPIACVETW
jgi:hypothetical protein